MMRPEEWKPVDGLLLEPNASLAVTEEKQSSALMAGPGSGKTETLAQRADFLLRTGCCRYPKRILAISFKIDAAQNLKDRVHKRCGISLARRFDSYTFHAFAKKIIDRFRPVLTGNNALDSDYQIGERRVARKQITFNELVPFAVEILENSGVARRAVRETYSDVFLDEFQDCTNVQYKLIKTVFQGADIRLVAVGDSKQKIMAWAGALEGIFTYFASDFNARSLNLYQNFRSKPRLRRMQNEIVRALDPASVVPDEDIAGNDGEIFVNSFQNIIDEAEFIAGTIENLISKDGVAPSEIAILVSKQLPLYTSKIMENLDEKGIAYRNEEVLQNLSNEPVVRLILDYLLVLFGNREPSAYERLVNLILSKKIVDEYDSSPLHIWQKYISRVKHKIKPLDTKTQFQKFLPRCIDHFLKKYGWENLISLSIDYEQGSYLSNIVEELKTAILDLYDRYADVWIALKHFDEDSAVRIMTIHKSKGLEFEAVFVQAVENETFWGNDIDERCAYFVAISRAKDMLFLTHTNQRARPEAYRGRWNVNRTPHQEFLSYANVR